MVSPLIPKKISPIIPKDANVKARLRKNLKTMKCEKLLDLPWNWEDDVLVKKVARRNPPPGLKDTIRARPEAWNKEMVAAAFQVSLKGEGLRQRSKAETISKYFRGELSPSDGWKFEQCVNQDLRDVLKFLIPLLKPNKPTRLNMGPVGTIADCLFEGLEVSWGEVILESIQKEVEKISTHRDSYLPAYLIHLYQDGKALTKDENRRLVALKRTMDLEGPEEEEEVQEEPPKVVQTTYEDLSDQEEENLKGKTTEQAKGSDQSENPEAQDPVQDQDDPDVFMTGSTKAILLGLDREPSTYGPQDPSWGIRGRSMCPPTEERVDEYLTDGFGKRFSSYEECEQVFAWFKVMQKKQQVYEESLRVAMAAASVDKPEDLKGEILRQSRISFGRLKQAEDIQLEKGVLQNKVGDLELQLGDVQEDLKKVQDELKEVRKALVLKEKRVRKLKNDRAYRKLLTKRLVEATATAQKVVDRDYSSYLAQELIENWVGPGKKAVDLANTLGKYTDDLTPCLKDLTHQILTSRDYLEARAGTPIGSEEEDEAGTSGASPSATESLPETPNEAEEEGSETEAEEEDEAETDDDEDYVPKSAKKTVSPRPEPRPERHPETSPEPTGAESPIRGLEILQDQAKASPERRTASPERKAASPEKKAASPEGKVALPEEKKALPRRTEATEEKKSPEKKSPSGQVRSPDSTRTSGGEASPDSKIPEWMKVSDPDLDNIPLTTAYGRPILRAEQVQPLLSVDPSSPMALVKALAASVTQDGGQSSSGSKEPEK